MKEDFKYRLYGRSKGRGKNTKISDKALKIKIKKIDPNKYNIIDIGVGYGESTIEIAQNDKTKNIVACEKYIDGINKIAENVTNMNCNNINIFHGNAHKLIDEYCTKKSISEIFILFPDPWPKKRHYKRRLIDVSFFEKLKEYLKDRAIVHIASDSKSYITSILLSVYEVRNNFKWLNQQKKLWNYEDSSMPKTKYYKKALKKGDNSFYLKLIKL